MGSESGRSKKGEEYMFSFGASSGEDVSDILIQ